MKIHVLTDIKDCVDGYTPILLNADGSINIEAPMNSVEKILMIGVLEYLPNNLCVSVLQNAINWLRLNGQLFIAGTDLDNLSLGVVNKTIDNDTYNSIISDKISIYSSMSIINHLKSLGLQIDKANIKGTLYEIKATRIG